MTSLQLLMSTKIERNKRVKVKQPFWRPFKKKKSLKAQKCRKPTKIPTDTQKPPRTPSVCSYSFSNGVMSIPIITANTKNATPRPMISYAACSCNDYVCKFLMLFV